MDATNRLIAGKEKVEKPWKNTQVSYDGTQVRVKHTDPKHKSFIMNYSGKSTQNQSTALKIGDKVESEAEYN